MPCALAATPFAAVPLALLLWLSGQVSFAAALGAMAVLSLVVFCAGFVLLRAAGALDLGAPGAWVLGIVASAIAIYASVMLLDILAASAFAAWSLFAVAAAAWCGGSPQVRRIELLLLALCGAAMLFWCWDVAQAPAVLDREGVMATWVDQFIHGAMISQFGDPRAGPGGSILLSGMPLWPYHYASYTVPAALAWPLDLPGFPLSTSVWTPVGFFTLCAGACVLGAALAGGLGAIGALAVVALLPDAPSYGLQNRAFAFHWLQVQVPGGSYGVGATLLAIALLQRWAAGEGRRPLAAGCLVLLASASIRLHIFLLAFPAWLLSAGLMAARFRGKRLALLGSAGALLALFVLAYYHLAPGATPAFAKFIEIARNPFHPVYHTWYPRLAIEHGPVAAFVGALLLLVPASLGVFAILYPASALLLHRVRGLQRIDLVPAAVLAFYLLLVLAAPVPPHGDPTEFTQRPFVLLYAVVAIWTAAAFAAWLSALGGMRSARARVILVGTAAVWIAWVLTFTVRDSRWTRTHEVAAGLPSAAKYLRSQSRPGDVLAVEGLWSGPVLVDDAVTLVALTGMPAYLGVPFVQSTLGGRAAEVEKRYLQLARAAGEAHRRAALEQLRALGVRWYVVLGESGPRWDPGRAHAAFAEGKTAVYATR